MSQHQQMLTPTQENVVHDLAFDFRRATGAFQALQRRGRFGRLVDDCGNSLMVPFITKVRAANTDFQLTDARDLHNLVVRIAKRSEEASVEPALALWDKMSFASREKFLREIGHAPKDTPRRVVSSSQPLNESEA